jgi:hypothetical protein
VETPLCHGYRRHINHTMDKPHPLVVSVSRNNKSGASVHRNENRNFESVRDNAVEVQSVHERSPESLVGEMQYIRRVAQTSIGKMR